MPQDFGGSIASASVQDPPTSAEIRDAISEAKLILEEAVFAREDGALDFARAMVTSALGGVRPLKDVRTQPVLVIFSQIEAQALALGMVETRLALGSWIVKHLAATRKKGHPALIAAQNSLAKARLNAGDPKEALELWQAVLDVAEDTLEEGAPNLTVSQSNVALALYALGDYEAARKLQEIVLVARADLPENNARRLENQEKYATTLRAMGEIDKALEIQSQVLAIREASLQNDEPGILRARSSLALIWFELSDFEGALDLLETVVAAREKSLSERDVSLLRARLHSATMYEALGDLDHARRLQRSVLDACEEGLPQYSNLRRAAQNNLAVTMFQIGDLQATRELQEKILAEAKGKLDDDHAVLLKTRNNLAMTLRVMGKLDEAREVMEAVIKVREAKLSDNHRDLLGARGNLALILHEDDDFEAARALEELVLKGLEESLPANHPDVTSARTNLGRTLYELGEFERARELQVAALDALSHLPENHPDLLQARGYLAVTNYILGETQVAVQLLDDQLNGLMGRFEAALTASPREARAISLEEATHISGALFLSEGTKANRNAELFSALETRRHVATLSANVSHFRSGPAGSLRREANRLSGDLNDLVLAGPAENQDTEAWGSAIAQASMELGRAQQALLEVLDQSGEFVRRIETAEVARKLPENSAAVGYHRYDRWRIDEETGKLAYDNPCILALVELPDGSVERVELGTVEVITKKIKAWRVAVGRPIKIDRGVSVGKPDQSLEEKTAKELRRILLDPVLAASKGATTLFVCLDDVLHLMPLDALLLDDGERVGDQFSILQEVSFARLLAPPRDSDAAPGMLVLGDVDFDAGIIEEPLIAARREAVAVVDAVAMREGTWGTWDRLIHTRYEVQGLELLFEDRFGARITPLTRERASKEALRAAVVGKRYIHLATHGWFTPEAVRSLADVGDADPLADRLGETLRGFAPLTLCGLCLAGANKGKDADGRMPGLLTAQELAGFNLSACDLAVLSACETNVGVHRAGQGILSLQTALHAAGARTAITSLWSVPDKATGDLMEYFYENLWQHGMGKAQALWQAKRKLRDMGLPVETWSGWVLTGDPD